VPDLSLSSPVPARVPTGFPALDSLLGGGWPLGVLTELLVPAAGLVEFGLLCPALTTLAGTQPAVLIAPPWLPYAPGLASQGLAPGRVLVVGARQPREVFWAMDEALRSGTCGAVVAWAATVAVAPGGPGRFPLRRLQLLAGRQPGLAVLVRAARCRGQRSPARLRLELRPSSPDRLEVEIFRNGWQATGAVTLERRF
jgi:hypothetical protein